MKRKKKTYLILIILTLLILSIFILIININNMQIKNIGTNKKILNQVNNQTNDIDGLRLLDIKLGETEKLESGSFQNLKMDFKILDGILVNHEYKIRNYIDFYDYDVNEEVKVSLQEDVGRDKKDIKVLGTEDIIGTFTSYGDLVFNNNVLKYIDTEFSVSIEGLIGKGISALEETEFELMFSTYINGIKIKETSFILMNEKYKSEKYVRGDFFYTHTYFFDRALNIDKLEINPAVYSLLFKQGFFDENKEVRIEVTFPEGVTPLKLKENYANMAEVSTSNIKYLYNEKLSKVKYFVDDTIIATTFQNLDKKTILNVKLIGDIDKYNEMHYIAPRTSVHHNLPYNIDLKNPNVDIDQNGNVSFKDPIVLKAYHGDKLYQTRNISSLYMRKTGGVNISNIHAILETIPYETKRIPQEDMLVGVTKTIQEGRNGKKINGVITHEPIKEIIHYGVRQKQVENEIREIPFEIEYRKIKEKNFNEKNVVTKGVLGQEEREKTTYINVETNEIVDAPSYTEWSVVKPKVNEVVEIGMKKLDIEKGDIPFKTEKRQNETLAVGEENVIQEGKVGLQERANISYVDPLTNMQDGETIYGEWNTVNEAVNQIIEYGVLDVETKTETEEIPFEVKYEYDTEKEYGIEEVKVEGQAGKRKRDVTIYSNVEAKKQIGETEYTEWNIETEKIDKVIVIGVKKKETEIEEIPYITIRRENPEMSKGEEKVVQEGKVGTREREAIYFVNPKTEEIIKQTEYGEWIEKEAKQDQIIEYGIKENVEIDEDKHEDSIINISRKERGVTNIPSKKEGKLPYAGISHKSKYIFATIIFVVLVNLFRSKYKKERKKVVKDKYINFS